MVEKLVNFLEFFEQEPISEKALSRRFQILRKHMQYENEESLVSILQPDAGNSKLT